MEKIEGSWMLKKHKDSYVCSRCWYVLPKKEAKVSGWDSQSSLSHIHCPKCGKIITHTPKFFIKRNAEKVSFILL